MTPYQFIAQNLHFAVDLLAALACFTAGWLYVDAWSGVRRPIELVRWIGFFLLSAGFLLTGIAWGQTDNLAEAAFYLKILGYLSLVIGEIIDPLQPKPDTSSLSLGLFGLAPTTNKWLGLALPVGALTMSLLYWRRATTGLERHLKPLAVTFALFALADGFAMAGYWRDTDNPLLQPVVAIGGPLWIIEHTLLLAAGTMLMWWIWRYLTKRLLTQLFLTTTSLTVGIVLVVTLSITTLLYNNLQGDALRNLETAGKTLGYAISSKTSQTGAQAKILAEDPAVVTAAATRNRTTLAASASTLLADKQLSEVIVASRDGQVMARATDPDRIGDSLSDDPLVKRALTTGAASSLTSHAGSIIPSLVITSAYPIRQGTTTTGVVLTSLALDNAFVDSIKSTTGLDSTLYSGAIRTATTLTDPDGSSRSTGAKETSGAIIKTTLEGGKPWSGLHNVSNQAFLTAYQPLVNINHDVVGMLFVGQPQEALFATAQSAIRTTFQSAGIWLVVILIPVYIVGRRIVGQLR